ncbi:unnamed protein product [Somion occarium]|uniref:Uncharacterized protein n=1 Tax=Somion occarium TaxID=3059160 RepID=A0ABP1DB57_9APHY
MFFMRSLSFLATLVFTFSLTHHVHADAHGSRGVAMRRRHPVNVLERRAQFANARFTFYKAGLGACGQVNGNDDFIVAMNVPQFNEGHCFETITLSYEGKTTQAQVVDECMGCPFGAIDLSPGLFSFLTNGNMDAGAILGEWSFGKGDPPKPTTTSTPPPPPPTTSHTPSTTSTPPPPPTTTSISTSQTPTSTSHSKTSSSTSSSRTSSATPTSTSSSAAPTPTQAVIEVGTLNSINQAFLGVAALAVVAGQAN